LNKKELRNAIRDSLYILLSALETCADDEEEPKKDCKKEKPKAPVKEKREVTLEEVRAAMTMKSGAGHTAKVKELLEKYGAAKLSQIEPEKYEALLAEVNKIGEEA